MYVEANADQWPRRMGHINARILEVLNKADAEDVRLSRGVSPWGSCAIEKSIWQSHPKKSNLGVTVPFI